LSSSGGSGLSDLEIASGLVFGAEEPRTRLPAASDSPIGALERVILPALRRPPCLVSFSGGRDSSAVLAVAARLARREQLPLPIPATNRFPAVETSDESEWQERVVDHLGLSDWIQLSFDDELDSVGPYATRILRRHGLLWPFNTHFHAPLLERARGGSLLTGVGGDEMLSPSSWFRATRVLSGRVWPVPRDVLRVGFALAPRRLRRSAIRRRSPENLFAWLHEHVRRRLLDLWADEAASEPIRSRRRNQWWLSLRYVRFGMSSVDRLGADEDVVVKHPLGSVDFAAAMADLPPRRRFGARSAAMLALFGDVLPEDALRRQSKASFDRAFWSTHSRRLVERWRGEGVDTDLVDLAALAELWSSPDPDPRSFTLLQAVWLAMSDAGRLGRDEVEQAFPGRG
jgi:asparagine synthetase B (glutamine-hydrolysing)